MPKSPIQQSHILANKPLAAVLGQLPAPVFSGNSRSLGKCPNAGGVYLLAMLLPRRTRIMRPTESILPPGLYCYAGSAHGPGGLRARLARHLAKEKSIRWHVDQLTIRASSLHVWAWLEGTECDLADQMQQSNGFHVPLPGFGSSDCTHCSSHLFANAADTH
nr:GIY-YIG nuclease family protein [uncultured Cohaesibacter sp.]